MNIIIIGNFHYPFGSASASRMRYFARGLSEAGANVRVISLIETYNRPEDVDNDGQRWYLDIPYESVMRYRWEYQEKKRNLQDKFFWFKNFVGAVKKTTNRVKDLIESEGVDTIIQYNRSSFALRPFLKLCRQNQITLIQDVVEWPNRHFYYGGSLHPRYLDVKLCLNWYVSKSDGVIGISHFLTDMYSYRGVPSICIPSIIEIPDKLPQLSKTRQDNTEFNVTYLGSLRHADGPFMMIESIRNVLRKEPHLKFTIVGTSGKTGLALKVKHACEKDRLLRKKVEFLGRVSDQEVVHKLQETDALLFIRPDNIAAKAAFPTRLPEYLITGNPVIVSGVGDIPKYLRDGAEAMVITPPCTAEKIAEKIEKLLHMPQRGLSIGMAGFERARECFNYKTRTKQILEFIQKLHKYKLKE